ncbi:MAG: hypothetical protein IKC81_03195 [Paludibacteraceae bacterium]|nr:hypothetical protein [Paludibacteraceae bacterium]
MDIQLVITIGIICIAAGYCIYKIIYRIQHPNKGCGCGCDGCHSRNHCDHQPNKK